MNYRTIQYNLRMVPQIREKVDSEAVRINLNQSKEFERVDYPLALGRTFAPGSVSCTSPGGSG